MGNGLKRLIEVQKTLKCSKENENSFGHYKYRSCEDILEAVKPLLADKNLFLHISDGIELIGDRYYIHSVSTIYDAEDGSIIATNSAYAREESEKKGMDASQITGTASSYARKYCLNGLFLIDDTKDADTNEFHNESISKEFIARANEKAKRYENAKPKCCDCGKEIADVIFDNGTTKKADDIAKLSLAKYGKTLCIECASKYKK